MEKNFKNIIDESVDIDSFTEQYREIKSQKTFLFDLFVQALKNSETLQVELEKAFDNLYEIATDEVDYGLACFSSSKNVVKTCLDTLNYENRLRTGQYIFPQIEETEN